MAFVVTAGFAAQPLNTFFDYQKQRLAHLFLPAILPRPQLVLKSNDPFGPSYGQKIRPQAQPFFRLACIDLIAQQVELSQIAQLQS